MANTSNMSTGLLEQISLRLTVVPDILPKGKCRVFIDSELPCLCPVEFAYLQSGIKPFTSRCQSMTGIGGGVDIEVA